MKKIISFILVIVLVFTAVPLVDVAAAKSTPKTHEGQELFRFINNKQNETLVKNSCYEYTKFVEEFRENLPEQYKMGMTNFFIKEKDDKKDYSHYYEPDSKKYGEVLTNIIVTYEMDNADKIADQKRQANLKSMKDDSIDVLELLDDTMSVAAGTSDEKNKIKEIISDVVAETAFKADNTNKTLDKISAMETLLQTYSDSYGFLELVEKNSEGELRKEALELKNAITDATCIRLESFNKVVKDENKRYMGYMFCDGFFEIIKQTEEYETDENLRFFTDAGEKVFSGMETLKDSEEPGYKTGALVGNLIAGGEDLTNRIIEMEAVYDIGNIVKDELMTRSTDFLNNIGGKDESKYVNEYITYSDYLAGCRIQGEYCLKSIVVSDAKLLSWSDMKNKEEAEEWYNDHTDGVLSIQNEVEKVKTAPEHKKKIRKKKESSNTDINITGSWTIDVEKTDSYRNDTGFSEYDSLDSEFGTGLTDYGSDLKFNSDNTFSYSVGISDSTTDGTYTVKGNTIYCDVSKHYYDHVEHIKYKFNIVKDGKILITEEGTNLNMPDDSMSGYVLVWTKK